MDRSFQDALQGGAAALGIEVSPVVRGLLERFADRLLAWNRKVNLTAITAPAEVAEKHLLDSLLLLRAVSGAGSLLDVGSGAGIPGVVLACARPDLNVACCDSIAKKVAFVKAVAVELGLERVRGVVARATGAPERDGLPRAEVVVSRALAEPAAWVPLGSVYLAPGGMLIAMLGKGEDETKLAELGAQSGLHFEGVERYELPFSRAARAVARWVAPK